MFLRPEQRIEFPFDLSGLPKDLVQDSIRGSDFDGCRAAALIFQ